MENKNVVTFSAQEKEAINIVSNLLLRLEGEDYQTEDGIDIDYDRIGVAADVLVYLTDTDKLIIK